MSKDLKYYKLRVKKQKNIEVVIMLWLLFLLAIFVGIFSAYLLGV